eukprot:6191550-Pleurochrysis_carterae.AAC.1
MAIELVLFVHSALCALGGAQEGNTPRDEAFGTLDAYCENLYKVAFRAKRCELPPGVHLFVCQFMQACASCHLATTSGGTPRT